MWCKRDVNVMCWQVKGGREARPIGAYELARAVQDLGAGEILLNCIDCDGMACALSDFVVRSVLV